MQLFSPGVVNINFEESCMSFFGVEERVISGVFPIPNRDRIQRITLEGLDLTLVAGPGRFVGEKVMYIPIDAILPEKLITELGLVGRLAGKNKNRVKTQKMGSYYSQGLTGPIGLDYSGITKMNHRNYLLVADYCCHYRNICPNMILKTLADTQK
jgi:hypothetical protein